MFKPGAPAFERVLLPPFVFQKGALGLHPQEPGFHTEESVCCCKEPLLSSSFANVEREQTKAYLSFSTLPYFKRICVLVFGCLLFLTDEGNPQMKVCEMSGGEGGDIPDLRIYVEDITDATVGE